MATTTKCHRLSSLNIGHLSSRDSGGWKSTIEVWGLVSLSLSLWLMDACLVPMSSHFCSSLCVCVLIFLRRTLGPPKGPHFHLIPLYRPHLQIPSCSEALGLGPQCTNLGGAHSSHSINSWGPRAGGQGSSSGEGSSMAHTGLSIQIFLQKD